MVSDVLNPDSKSYAVIAALPAPPSGGAGKGRL